MSQCVVMNVTESGDWVDQSSPHPRALRALGLHIPVGTRPSLVHESREAAEREAARLVTESGLKNAEFAVFELVGLVRAKHFKQDPATSDQLPTTRVVPRWLESPLKI